MGFRVHSGWAAAVAAAGTIEEPVVLERRRIVFADPGIEGSKQPFHASESLSLDKAEALIRKCLESSVRLAVESLKDLVGDRAVVAAAVLFAAGRALPDLGRILKSHALIHTAEGEFFRDIVIEACKACRLPVVRIREREIRELQPRIAGLGRSLGPPWTQDQKLASLAAWKALAEPAYPRP